MIAEPDNLLARDRRCLWHPYTQMLTAPEPLPIERGQGVYLYTEDGRKILDGISSWWVNIHGHSNPRLNQALARQARELEHVVFAGCTHRPAVFSFAAAERIDADLLFGQWLYRRRSGVEDGLSVLEEPGSRSSYFHCTQ